MFWLRLYNPQNTGLSGFNPCKMKKSALGQGLAPATAAIAGQRPEVGKRLAKLRGYVYGPEPCLVAVFAAAVKVLSTEFGLRASEETYSRTKIEPLELRRSIRVLKQNGFFESDEFPVTLARDLRKETRSTGVGLIERFLRVATPRILQVGERLGRYQSPDGVPVSTVTTANHLRRFDCVERVRVALRFLETIDFKDRAFFVRALQYSLAESADRIDPAFLCPLGSTGDSSAMLSYLMGDVSQGLRRDVLQLEVALEASTTQGLILWDDFCGQGGHAITTLAQWLGAEEQLRRELGTGVVLGERLARPLEDRRAQQLRELPVDLSFGLATPTGLENIRKAMDALGLDNFSVIPPLTVVPNEDRLAGDPRVFHNADEERDFYKFVRGKARQIHRPKTARPEYPWTREKVEQRLLGYGNWAARVVFFYNLPSITLTVLWDGGKSWTPLLRGRSKPSASQAVPR